jgi:antibiotic biosynthesis monooxygenase (ABM) superfamily enzyme
MDPEPGAPGHADQAAQRDPVTAEGTPDEDRGDAAGADPPVTVSVARRVRPGREADFERSLEGIIPTFMTFPGQLGVHVFRPSAPGENEYVVIFKFDHVSNLRRWEESDERNAWYAAIGPLVEGEPRRRVVTGLETWFTLPGQRTITPPPRHKMVVITWLAVYPLITAIFFLGQPLLMQLPLALRTLLLTVLMVPAMTYLIMPGMARVFRRWLYPSSERRRRRRRAAGP